MAKVAMFFRSGDICSSIVLLFCLILSIGTPFLLSLLM